MIDNSVVNMTPGEVLLDVPVADMIQKLGVAIAEAQLRLDQVGVNVATILSEAKVDFKKENGDTVTKSLLELGFTPTFYQFTETEIEVKLTMSMKVEEGLDIGGEATAGSPTAGENRAVAWGASISADYHRKFEFDVEGSSMVKTKLVSVPPPAVFIDTIKEHARAG